MGESDIWFCKMRNVEEELLAKVGPRTPSGEVFRRYWLPVEVSANLGGGSIGFSGARNPIRERSAKI